MGCPQPERIADIVAGTLAVEERGDVLDHAATCPSCHALLMALDTLDATPPTTPPGALPNVGDVIGRYELTGMLGVGGMGVVFRARDRELGRDVAIKVLRPGRPAERLMREAQTLARLDAPNVITIYDVGTHAGAVYIVMELVAGQSLRGFLEEPHPRAEILAVCLRAGAGLAAAHRAGIVHRDFKPDNVLVARDGSVHVGDFGLAGASPGEPRVAPTLELTVTGTVLGTPAYMAPEQIDGEATAASDQYAFCVTVWEALTGKRPIDAPTIEPLFAAIRAGAIAAPARPLPAHVERALRRGLSLDPAARFPDMPALLAALAPRRRARWIAAGIATVAAVAVAGAVGLRHTDEAACALAPNSLVLAAADRTAIERAFDGTLRARIEAALAAWEAERARACKLHDAPRLACLALIASRTRSTIAQLAVPSALDPDLGELDVERGLPRCLAVAPALVPALAVFDVEAARVDALLQQQPALGARALAHLDAIAKPLGTPATLRTRWLTARAAARRGDHTATFAMLSSVIADAEQLHDDELRARASALHAELLGRVGRPAEARVALDQARASWQRAGDPDELVLGAAEIAVLVAENQPARAAERAERLVTTVRARFPSQPFRITQALGVAITLWIAAGDLARSGKLRVEQQAVFATAPAPGVMTPEERAAMIADSTAMLAAGDHRGSIDLMLRNVEVLRRVIAARPTGLGDLEASLGYMLSGLGQTYELFGQPGEAVVWYRNLHALTGEAEALDAVVRQRFASAALEGEARNLNRLGQEAAAIAPARAALALVQASSDRELVDSRLPVTVQLARALFATGKPREAVELLEPAVPALREVGAPFTRAVAEAYLAYALWETGDERDRGRARALAGDATKDFETARVVIEGSPALRPVLSAFNRDTDTLARWRSTH